MLIKRLLTILSIGSLSLCLAETAAWAQLNTAELISVAGGLRTGVGYSLAGASHDARQSNMNLPLPFPDALQEFQVATSAVSAENGVKSGAAVNAVTKSG